jgi:hypothetical protein
MSSASATPVAWSVPVETIEGLEDSAVTQEVLQETYALFRNIMLEPTGMRRKYLDSVISYSDAGKSFSISPLPGSSFEYYISGKKYTVSTTLTFTLPTVANPALNEGQWFFYFDVNGLQGSQTAWVITDPIVLVSNGYWDSTNQIWIRKNEERHGVRMDSDTHKLLHRTDGSKIDQDPSKLMIYNYTLNGTGTLNTDAQFGITDGTFYDEDVSVDIKHANVPANPFEQYLQPYAKLPGFYLIGTDNWRKHQATDFPIYHNPTGTCSYNMLSGSTWSVQPCTNGYFFATWLIYTDDYEEPVIWVLGQRQDSDLISAINNNTRFGDPINGTPGLSVPRRFSEECYFYKKLIWETSTSFTNTPRARLRFVATSTEITPASDRYAAIAAYNGNASNRFLEFYPGQTSDTSPFPIPDSSYLRTMTLTSTAASTGTVTIYKSTNLTLPIATISLSGSVYVKSVFAVQLLANDKLVAKVTSGSINKPCLTLWVQTSL